MAWNWQLEGWPNFVWDSQRFLCAEAAFLLGAGRLQGIAQRLGLVKYDDMLALIMSEEAVSLSIRLCYTKTVPK